MREAKVIEMRGLMIWSAVTAILSSGVFYKTLEFAAKNSHPWDMALIEATCVTVVVLMAFSAVAVLSSMDVAFVPGMVSIGATIVAASVASIAIAGIANINSRVVAMLIAAIIVTIGVGILIRRTLPDICNCNKKILEVAGVQALAIFFLITVIIHF